MEYLNWELSVLTRAVVYPNLSGAAIHVGISQPQLSRIVSRLEEQLGVTLLDREARRRSAWTPAAFRVAEIYGNALKGFRGEMLKLVEGSALSHLRMGALEGLIPLGLQIAHLLMQDETVRVLEFHVQDLNALEESFARQDLDLALTSREPGRKKYKFERRMGWQMIETQKAASKGGSRQVPVMSSFEYGAEVQSLRHPPGTQVFVSNSLEVRKTWITRFGGVGTMPSDVRREKTGKPGEVPVLLIANDDFTQSLWARLNELK